MPIMKGLSVEEAAEIVLAEVRPLPTERCGLRDVLGRRLAEDAFAPRPHPPFPAAIKDGYAVRAADGSAEPFHPADDLQVPLWPTPRAH
jgi:gephyrin